MVEINLLPDELRGQEEAERKRLSKTPKVVEMRLTNPDRPGGSKLQHGGAGMGRPVVPRPGPLPPNEPLLPPLPATPLPRLERVVVPRGGAAKPAITTLPPLPARPAAPPRVSPAAPSVRPSAYHLNDREVAKLAEAVRREVEAAQRKSVSRGVAVGVFKKPRRGFWGWLRSFFTRPPLPLTRPVVAPAVPPVRPQPLPPPLLPRVEVKVPVLPPVVIRPALPRMPRPPRKSLWQRLLQLFARPPKPVKPTLPQLKPLLPPPPPPKPTVPAVKIVSPRPLSVPGKQPLQKKPRRTFWAWLKSLFRRKPKPVKLSLPPLPKLAPLPPVKPVPPPPPKPMPPAAPPVPPRLTMLPPTTVPPPAPAKTAMAAPKLQPVPVPKITPQPVPPKLPLKPGKTVERPTKTLAINLIPEEYARHPELNLSRKFLLYLSAIGVSVFVVLTMSQLISWYDYLIGNEIEREEQRIKILVEQIDQYRGLVDEASAIQRDVKLLEDLLQRHRHWTKALAALERTTIDEVYYTTFASGADGSLALSAHGRDYRSVARQIVAFRQAADVIQRADISSATAITDAVTKQILQVDFSVGLILRPEVFFEPLEFAP
ncbi:MAG: hypothetical protein Q7S23_01955 [bacterium]|nr:hypothetical protein [bacterium]